MKYKVLKPVTYKGKVVNEGIIELDKNEVRDTLVKRGVLEEIKKNENSDENKLTVEQLEENTVSELKEIAEKMKVELKAKDTKEEIIKKISEVI
jgi:DNA primase large subunit